MPAPDRQGQACGPGREAPAADVRLEGPRVPRRVRHDKAVSWNDGGRSVRRGRTESHRTAGWHSAQAEPVATSNLSALVAEWGSDAEFHFR
jgi:hypothetical protein